MRFLAVLCERDQEFGFCLAVRKPNGSICKLVHGHADGSHLDGTTYQQLRAVGDAELMRRYNGTEIVRILGCEIDEDLHEKACRLAVERLSDA